MNKLLATTALLLMCSAIPAFAMDDMMMNKDMKMMCEKKFDMMDTNKDGMISMEEHEAGAKMMFMDADINHDNMVSKDEHMAMMKKDMMMMKDMKMDNSKMMMKK